MTEKQYGFDTLAIHAGYVADQENHSVMLPIYQTTAYEFESSQHAKDLFELKALGNIYSRINNPTVTALEERIAALDGGVGALCMASGHAVIFNTLLNLAGAGDEIVSSLQIYGGAINMLNVTLRNIGIDVKFVKGDSAEEWESLVTPKTKAFFLEAVGNPNANVADIPAIAAVAHKHGIPLIVDSTFTTPYLCKPIELGADIVVHSATKYLGGQGTSMCGVAVDSGNFSFAGNPRFPQYNEPDVSYHGAIFAKDFGNAGFIIRLRTLMLRDVGACLSPFNAFFIYLGIETLGLRMARHCENALAVAQWLEAHPKVAKVNFAGLPSSPYYKLAQTLLPKGTGAVFTFELEGSRETGAQFIDALKLIKNVANVGDSRTLVIHPASTTHSQLSEDQLVEAGITARTVRLSVGLENVEDIIADLAQAIDAATK